MADQHFDASGVPKYPAPEFVDILHRGTEATVTLSVVAEGKQQFWTLSRRQLCHLMASGYTAFAKMEGAPRTIQ